MSGKGHRAYNNAPTKEKLREWGSLSREGDKIKFVNFRVVRWGTKFYLKIKKMSQPPITGT